MTCTRGARSPGNLCGELLFDQPVQVVAYRCMIEALDDFVEEARDEEALGDFGRDAARTQIKELVFFDLAGRCAVGATDIVGEDFETGH